ncbi:phosphate ABC transporter permease PstA [Tianweitania sp. BSSL-BM11]|uniref:Phosphate transport system permease protein PstA n=1 Tax=Tianweitania aestuarii TaxID=2814886 RepID=A0ABS5S0E8_9HYPH|nr:phosphate ABC transporter permease PstA [Tianweitania aestuarii]MBS9722540.1 phosphate ABC transporter permease PstA [Tianweitania aestuarii]
MSVSAMSSPAASAGSPNRSRIQASLRRRRNAEKRFRFYGIASVTVAIGFVLFLFSTILHEGLPAFWQPVVKVDVTFDPAIIKVDPKPVADTDQSPAALRRANLDWQRKVTMVNWNRIIENSIRAEAPDVEMSARDVQFLVSQNERYRLRDMFVENPDLLGKTVPIELLASANVDVWLKGDIDRSLASDRQQLPEAARMLADRFYEDGRIRMAFSSVLFTNTDSRNAPAEAGLLGAFIGSLYMMIIVIVLAVPVGVASAIYLEEFAPKNKLTDLIEVNINNLAAVPSIVFGLLGAAVFINYFHLPLSAPMAGGLVLSLMTLPTVIIATRASLRAVPPSLRQAALGLGASRTQTVFHHVLPVTYPGILTATIIGVAQAIGETAPLLLIGMNAFVTTLPVTPLDQSTALPVQIFLWEGNENRNYFEPKTAAAIIVLLSVMLALNAIAIVLRSRFERRA